MDKHPNELVIPAVAAASSDARELLRVWAAGGNQHVSIATGRWKDPAAWGIMLVDLARHIANAYHLTTGMNADAALMRLRSGFDAEWTHSTDTPMGGIQD